MAQRLKLCIFKNECSTQTLISTEYESTWSGHYYQAKPYSKPFAYLNVFGLHNNPLRQVFNCLHFR